MRIRIGIRGAGELDLEVEDAAAVVAAYNKAVAAGDTSLEIAESGGGATTVTVEHVVYVRVDAPKDRAVGFGG